MIVSVYARHTSDCPKNSGWNWKRCRCPKWLYYREKGKPHRTGADTRSWEKAELKGANWNANTRSANGQTTRG